MTLFSAILVYVLAWWMVFFCMLPFGIESIKSTHDGSMPGAPVNPRLKKKIIFTTIISAAVWIVIWLLIRADVLDFHDIAARMSM